MVGAGWGALGKEGLGGVGAEGLGEELGLDQFSLASGLGDYSGVGGEGLACGHWLVDHLGLVNLGLGRGGDVGRRVWLGHDPVTSVGR